MQSLNFNIFNTIILAGIIQGLIFGFFLLYKKKFLLGNFYLACTVFCLSLNNLEYWISDIGLTKIHPYIGYIYIPFELLIIPSFCFFVNLYLELKMSKTNKYLLLIPFITNSLVHLLFTIDNIFYKNLIIDLKFKNYFFIFEEYLSFTLSIFLIIIIFKEIKAYKLNNTIYDFENVTAKTRWLQKILSLGLILCFGWIIIIYLMGGNNNNIGFKLYYPLWISISILIYWISYASANNYSLLLERQKLRVAINNVDNLIKPKKILSDNKNIFQQFENTIQKSYTNPLLM